MAVRMIVVGGVIAGDDDVVAWITRMTHGGMEKVDYLLASWEFVVLLRLTAMPFLSATWRATSH